MSCQIHATRSARDSGGKNYRPVATVTPRTQKTPCRGLGKGDLCDFIAKNHSRDHDRKAKGGLKENRGKRLAEKEESQRRRGRVRQCFTCSRLQPLFRQSGSLLSLYFYTVRRNTSSAIHFIFIPTPGKQFAFCQFYPFLSFLHMPLHFLNENILATSTMELRRPKHDTGCIQNRRTLFSYIRFLTVSLSLHRVLVCLSDFQQQSPPLDRIQIFAI